MECHDYADPSTEDNKATPPEFVYKLNFKEIEQLVKLRMSNLNLFNRRRKNSSMCAWRAILKHMGLQDKMTHYQAAKKWENMKKKYKELKYPPEGVTVNCQWAYFPLMDDAMAGRLECSAPVLFTTQDDEEEVLSLPKRKKKSLSEASPSSHNFTSTSSTPQEPEPEITVMLNGDEGSYMDTLDISRIMQEMDHEKQSMKRHKQVMEREHTLLQRERAALDREVAALERDRASLDRDRAAIEREKSLLDRERTLVGKEREAVSKDRQALEQEKARLESSKVRTEDGTDNMDNITDRKERFLFLFEKLINNF